MFDSLPQELKREIVSYVFDIVEDYSPDYFSLNIFNLVYRNKCKVVKDKFNKHLLIYKNAIRQVTNIELFLKPHLFNYRMYNAQLYRQVMNTHLESAENDIKASKKILDCSKKQFNEVCRLFLKDKDDSYNEAHKVRMDKCKDEVNRYEDILARYKCDEKYWKKIASYVVKESAWRFRFFRNKSNGKVGYYISTNKGKTVMNEIFDIYCYENSFTKKQWHNLEEKY